MRNSTALKTTLAGIGSAFALNFAVATDANATSPHHNGGQNNATANQVVGIDVNQATIVKPVTNVGIEQDINVKPVTNVGIEQNIAPVTNVPVTIINQGHQGGGGRPIDVDANANADSYSHSGVEMGNVGSTSSVRDSGNLNIDGPLGGHGGSVSGVEGGDARATGGSVSGVEGGDAINGPIDNSSKAGGGSVGTVAPSQETHFVNRNVTPPPSMGNVWMAQAASACNKQQYFNLSMAAAFMGGGGLGYGKTSVAATPFHYTAEDMLAMKPDDRLAVMNKHDLSNDEKATVMCLTDNYGKIKMQFETQYKQAISVEGIRAEANMYTTEVNAGAQIKIEQMRQTGNALGISLAQACKNPNSNLCKDSTQTLLNNISAAGSDTPERKRPTFVNVPVLGQ